MLLQVFLVQGLHFLGAGQLEGRQGAGGRRRHAGLFRQEGEEILGQGLSGRNEILHRRKEVFRLADHLV